MKKEMWEKRSKKERGEEERKNTLMTSENELNIAAKHGEGISIYEGMKVPLHIDN